tara:strand:- start:5405 stop:7393 length:1989 start_codon:yes stop_codon:yes gene_type:complete
MAVGKTLTVLVSADVSKLTAGLSKGRASLRDFANGTASLGDVMKANMGPALIGATVAAGAFAVAIGVDGVKAALEDEKAVAKLSQTMGNLGFQDRTKESLAFIDSLQRQYGVSEDLLRPAFERLMIATKNVGLSQKDLQLAMDVSAGTGKSLESVSNALGKAYEGNFGALGKLGVGLDKAVLKTKDMDAITSKLSETFDGQAATAAGTMSGKFGILSIAVDEAKEAIGVSLVNAMDKFFTKVGGPGGAEEQVDNFGTTVANTVTGFSEFTDWLMRTPAEVDKVATSQELAATATVNWTQTMIQAIPLVGSYIDALGLLGSETAKTAIYEQNLADAANQKSGPALQKAAEVIRKYGKAIPVVNDNLNGNTTATLKAAAAQKILEEKYQATLEVFNLAKTKLSDATRELEKWNSEIDSFISTTAKKITTGIDIGAAFTAATSEAGKAAGLTTAQAFQDQIAASFKFGNLLQKLKSSGAQDNLIQQVADVGPEAGIALAEDLIKSGLIPTLQASLNDVQAQAATLAASMVPPFLLEGQSAARGLIATAIAEFHSASVELKAAGEAAGKAFGLGLRQEIEAAIKAAQASLQNVQGGTGMPGGMFQTSADAFANQALIDQEMIDIANHNATYVASLLSAGSDLDRVIRQSNNRNGWYEMPVVTPVLQ